MTWNIFHHRANMYSRPMVTYTDTEFVGISSETTFNNALSNITDPIPTSLTIADIPSIVVSTNTSRAL